MEGQVDPDADKPVAPDPIDEAMVRACLRIGKEDLLEGNNEDTLVIRKVLKAQELAIQDFQAKQKEGKIGSMDKIPKKYQKFKKVFDPLIMRSDLY